jgi:cytochrome c oxidase cbb3-type subunit I/II
VIKILPLYWARAAGGTLYLVGFVLLIWNVIKTIQAAPKLVEPEVYSYPKLTTPRAGELGQEPHRMLEGLPLIFTVLTFAAIMIGTVVELLPTFMSGEFSNTNSRIKPYTGLQLHGRDLYVREGCYTCHSQMIRPLVFETKRYGDFSRAEESMYDHPFQWGSKRTGPDLARVGGKYPDLWHYRHFMDPREIVQGSIMPSYTWLSRSKTDFSILRRKLQVMKSLGVPYTDSQIERAESDAQAEAKEVAQRIEKDGGPNQLYDKEIIALISYMQRLGEDFRNGVVK